MESELSPTWKFALLLTHCYGPEHWNKIMSCISFKTSVLPTETGLHFREWATWALLTDKPIHMWNMWSSVGSDRNILCATGTKRFDTWVIWSVPDTLGSWMIRIWIVVTSLVERAHFHSLSQSKFAPQPSPARPAFQHLHHAPARSVAPGHHARHRGTRAQILNIPPVTLG